jgi:FkbM family methyltransferase
MLEAMDGKRRARLAASDVHQQRAIHPRHHAMSDPQSEAELIWEFFGRRADGVFVEIGANDPETHSQTRFLEERGWTGILVEPLSRFFEPLKAARPRSTVFQVACGAPGHALTVEIFVGQNPEHSSLCPHALDVNTRYIEREIVPMLTLDEVLAQVEGAKPDFVSIDVEGFQRQVLEGFSLKWHRPALLLIEDHLLDWKTHFYLRQQGYRLVKRTELNNWYVPTDGPAPRTTSFERIRLWRKVWPGTPARMFKAWLRRAAGGRAARAMLARTRVDV